MKLSFMFIHLLRRLIEKGVCTLSVTFEIGDLPWINQNYDSFGLVFVKFIKSRQRIKADEP